MQIYSQIHTHFLPKKIAQITKYNNNEDSYCSIFHHEYHNQTEIEASSSKSKVPKQQKEKAENELLLLLVNRFRKSKVQI